MVSQIFEGPFSEIFRKFQEDSEFRNLANWIEKQVGWLVACKKTRSLRRVMFLESKMPGFPQPCALADARRTFSEAPGSLRGAHAAACSLRPGSANAHRATGAIRAARPGDER